MPLISDSIGRVLGNRYRLISALGSGASAHVYLAEDVILQRPVAVKVLQPTLARDEGFLRRFRAEARAVAALNHPHVVRVFDWGEDADGPYLVVEHLGGGSLQKSTSRPRSLLVEKAATRTALRLSARTIRYGSEHAERFSVRVRPQYSGVPGWKVIIFARRAGIRPFAVCTIALKNAQGSCRPSARRFRPGTYQITARYRGSRNFRASASSRHRLRVR